MLPPKAIQLNYQDFSQLVWKDLEKINIFLSKKNISLNLIISKLKNGTYVGNILSNYYNVPIYFLEPNNNSYELLLSQSFFNQIKEIRKDKQSELKINVLLVDSVSSSGNTFKKMKDYLNSNFPEFNVFTYCPLICNTTTTNFPFDITGYIEPNFIQTPWEWTSFTPDSHLFYLMHNMNLDNEDKPSSYYYGFSSSDVYDEFVNYTKFELENSFKIFESSINNKQIQSSSGVSNIVINNNIDLSQLNYIQYYNKYKKIIDEKVNFILINGITHYIEENLIEALLISNLTPVTHVVHYANNSICKLNTQLFNKNLDYLFKKI